MSLSVGQRPDLGKSHSADNAHEQFPSYGLAWGPWGR